MWDYIRLKIKNAILQGQVRMLPPCRFPLMGRSDLGTPLADLEQLALQGKPVTVWNLTYSAAPLLTTRASVGRKRSSCPGFLRPVPEDRLPQP
jgi:hypothetical protein